ncbi:terminase family protein [Vibrio sp. SCSIO 43136]|uniref:terminase large subunit domain-containing protein n=1 Tax=Vibrio sp. SCSIO 43136 TaxID=2819101 RepID=UPI00207546F2|nr:terminase family protein [Vibrio sp. SCSIO 43136]USD64219.1 terminase family protein [Vibrio sp. SCSIO 43136]
MTLPHGLSPQEKQELLVLLEERERRAKKFRYKKVFEMLYGWQREFIANTAEFSEVCLCAANRIGKTFTGTYIDAIHALGDYPDDWDGHKFEHAPLIWCLGYSGEKTRDLLQMEIFGIKGEDGFEGGLVPPERILSWESMTGTPGAMRTVRVQHASGGVSTVQFWSYSQGQHALMGDSVDWFHIDEEPRDQAIHPQVLTRTATGDKGLGGRGILTFTPENGRTDLVIKFMDNPGKGQKFMQKGWDDAPHLSESVKEKLLESFPPHQRDMRTKGIPMLGHGRIYDMSEDFITVEPFDIPKHWHVIGGMDFGWDHPQAQIRLAIDLDTDTIYLTHAWKCERVSANDAWGAVKPWQEGVPIAWPHDGLMHEKGRDNSKQQKDHYEDAGFNMLFDRATWDGTSNSVEQGIYEIRERLQRGKFKVFRGVRAFFDEFNQYHRDDKGKIVKVRDDVLDAVRYGYMMRRFAIPLGEVGEQFEAEDIEFDSLW